MARMTSFAEQFKPILASPPLDHNSTAMTASYISMKYIGHVTIVISVGAWAGGTSAVSLLQSTDVTNSLTDAKALAFTVMWTDLTTSGTLVETAVVASTFNLTAASVDAMYIIEVDATSLDATNNFDCLTLVVGTPGASADLYGVAYYGSQLRYPQSTPPSIIVD